MNIAAATLKSVQAQVHPFCFVCNHTNSRGLALDFTRDPDGALSAVFEAAAELQGYPGLVHGGIIASLLDGLMTNCLFAHRIAAVTAELTLRYHEPVRLDSAIALRGWIAKRRPPLYLVEADLRQNGRVKARASAKFMARKHL